MRSSFMPGMRLAVALVATVLTCSVGAQEGRLTVGVDRPGIKISPMFYGLMTEEINHSYDGGLYAELIQNRAFKDNTTRPVHWAVVQEGAMTGEASLDTSQPVNAALPVALRLTTTGTGGRVGIANDGYWGIPVKPNTRYRASFFVRTSSDFHGPLTASLESSDGQTVFAKASVSGLGANWKQVSLDLKTAGSATPSTTNRFVLSTQGSGTVWFNLVSLFPPTTRNRANGLRPDLMEMMGAMQPAFLRLPGGNYLEGNTVAERFDWKKTLGPIAERPGHLGPWGYRSTDGMGLMEYLLWCEDLKIEPILAVFAGYALQGEYVAPGPKLTPFVQDALEEIEYLTGDKTTRWGAQRAKDGHPAPFPLHYVEIGNEDAFDRSGSYDGRFAQFFDAIKAKYPKLELIATAPVRGRRPDVIDDHYYRSAREMARDSHHYDRTDRTGPKIFVGEWASTEGSPTPTLQAALGDAAWLTGLERNSDIVPIQCYAPLLVNVNPGARQWGTNLIGYDALKSFGSPSYYVQKMFGANRGDVVLPVEIVPQPVPPAPAFVPKGAVGVGTWATQAQFKDVQVTHNGQTLYQNDFTTGAADWKSSGGAWRVQTGVMSQTSDAENVRTFVGDPQWTDYTYRVKARKLRGREGFLILFHVQDTENYLWWNVGGWGNTRTVLERATNGAKAEIGNVTNMSVETGRWYDVRIEVQGRNIRCYLDDKLITEAVDTPTPAPDPLYATASRDEKSGDVIVKVVNMSGTAQALRVDLQGLRKLSGGTALVLAGQPGDINTVAAPERVAPKTVRLTATQSGFSHTFPPYSATVMRLKAR
jgi:alpha-L-arabinofuranosidase